MSFIPDISDEMKETLSQLKGKNLVLMQGFVDKARELMTYGYIRHWTTQDFLTACLIAVDIQTTKKETQEYRDLFIKVLHHQPETQ